MGGMKLMSRYPLLQHCHKMEEACSLSMHRISSNGNFFIFF